MQLYNQQGFPCMAYCVKAQYANVVGPSLFNPILQNDRCTCTDLRSLFNLIAPPHFFTHHSGTLSQLAGILPEFLQLQLPQLSIFSSKWITFLLLYQSFPHTVCTSKDRENNIRGPVLRPVHNFDKLVNNLQTHILKPLFGQAESKQN